MATKPALKLVQLDKPLAIPLGDNPGPLDRAIADFLQSQGRQVSKDRSLLQDPALSVPHLYRLPMAAHIRKH